jgi:threonine dehydrogenase-like Zn-dependent dehydrogenase
MVGALPDAVVAYALDGAPTRVDPEPPGPAEVWLKVAGCALGVEPQAEVAGEVVAAGEAAAEWLGRRVAVPRLLPCGDCDRCRRGHPARCERRWARRGLATHERLPARWLLALDGTPPLWPSTLDAGELWRAAALADAASAPHAALCRAGLGPGDQVAILGDGPRALFACAVARALGAHPTAVADLAAHELLRAAGAEATLDAALAPSELDAAIVLETTGRSAARHRALAMLAPGASAVFLDGGTDGIQVPPPDWTRFCAGEQRLYGAEAPHPDLLPELAALFARGELPIDRVLVPLAPSELPTVTAELRQGRRTGLAVLRF